jgi:hypothetical protein
MPAPDQDWADDPQAQEFFDHVEAEALPKIQDSALTMLIAPTGKPDMKIAVELGLSILLDKPIVAVKMPGAPAHPGLERIAHAVVEWDPNDPEKNAQEVQDAIASVLPDDAVIFDDSATREDPS